MDKVMIKEGILCIKTLSDGTKGRFDSRDNQTMYVSLEDNHSVFYSQKLTGNIESMNESLEKFEIVLEYV